MGVSFVFTVLVLTGLIRPSRDGADIVIEYLKKENIERDSKIQELVKTVEAQGQKIEQQSKEITMLRTQIILLESSHYDHPYPSWWMDMEGHLVLANQAFESLFLIPEGRNLVEVNGNAPGQLFGNQAGLEYLEKHNWVLSRKRPWEGAINFEINGKSSAEHVVLYPRYSGKQIIGVSGMVIPLERIDNF